MIKTASGYKDVERGLSNTPSFFAFSSDLTKRALDKVVPNFSNPLHIFLFKRVAGTPNLYTIRSREAKPRFLSIVGGCQGQLYFYDNVMGLGEVWRITTWINKDGSRHYNLENEWQRTTTGCKNLFISVDGDANVNQDRKANIYIDRFRDNV